ncbi:CypX, Cytochrome P450 [Pyrenophora tritici-repentis]|nr:CypX Cytochrome P450 [Pyrenophora tritici-repentis]KAI1586215.1 CypX Cytochrome P450 [Pyrenophora tritici-repentis]PZD46021.1 CypX, Cytochrome P450 [Pyrenophora tritici-repentis]
MHSSILIGLWVSISFIIYRIVASIITSHRHAANARRLGCLPAPKFNDQMPLDIFNIRTAARISKADKERRVPQYIQSRVHNACEVEGKTVSTFYANFMGSEGIFTVEPRNIQAILATQFKDFGLGELRNESFSPLLGRGIFSSDGEQWSHARALLRPQFARDQVGDLNLNEKHMQHMMRALPINSNGWTDVTDIQRLFFRLTLDSATEFLFGASVDSQLAALPGYTSSKAPGPVSEGEFAVSFDQAQSTIAAGTRLGIGYWLTYDKQFKKNCKQCHTFIDFHVERVLSGKKTNQKTASGKEKYVFLDALAEATRDPAELRFQSISILLAGRDTTASLLSYVFMLLSQHTDIYQKLRAVVTQQFGTYSKPQNLSFEKLKSCNYLQWVMSETLRLYPVVPFDTRCALRDTTLPVGGGPDGTAPVYLKKGMHMDYSVYVMHRRKDLWGEDAGEFRPERFEGRKGGWEFLPFNGGPRICMGQQFALTEAGFVIVRMAQRFDEIEGVGNSWEPVERGGCGYTRHAASLSTCPADGVKVRMKEAKH